MSRNFEALKSVALGALVALCLCLFLNDRNATRGVPYTAKQLDDSSDTAEKDVAARLRDVVAELQSTVLAVQEAAVAMQEAAVAMRSSAVQREPSSSTSLALPVAPAAQQQQLVTAAASSSFDPNVPQSVLEFYRKNGFKACQTSVPKGECWLSLTKYVDCTKLFQQYLTTMATHKPVSPAPENMPPEWKDLYLLDGAVELDSWYISEVSADTGTGPALVLSQQHLDNLTAIAKTRPDSFGPYNTHVRAIYGALDCHPVSGLAGAVFGTRDPWVEALLLANGAAKLTTIEYARIESHVKNLEAMTPREWAAGWLNRTLPQPDFLFSFSSLEHDGLARYGDPLNPWGDVESMHRMSCYLKPGGLLYLNVPTYSRDMLFWNAHRVYSTARYPLLTSNWKVTAVFSADADLGGCAGNSCAALWEHIKDETHPLAPGIVVVLSNQQPTACQGG